MKFKVFDSTLEPEIFFKVEECFDTVQLVACSRDGKRIPEGTILSIQNDGSLRTFDSVSDNLGLKLDCDGRIIIDND